MPSSKSFVILKFKIYPKAHEVISLLGYRFQFVQYLIPDCNDNGQVIKLFPQKRRKGRKLHKFGKGAFCSFHIDTDNSAGVYLWVLRNEILYVGRTKNLAQRFNNGYGRISATNCYEGGTITNCRMNKVLLELFEQGKIISLYFYKTRKHKVVERNILHSINTPYNIKDN
ncbi:MAG: hypothetical protein IJ587_05925 [Synergistaceae bacterium]|nr:hypothetical protein [Synergistaceae bacterium]